MTAFGNFALIGWPEILVILLLLSVLVGIVLIALVTVFLINNSKRDKSNHLPSPRPPPEKHG